VVLRHGGNLELSRLRKEEDEEEKAKALEGGGKCLGGKSAVEEAEAAGAAVEEAEEAGEVKNEEKKQISPWYLILYVGT